MKKLSLTTQIGIALLLAVVTGILLSGHADFVNSYIKPGALLHHGGHSLDERHQEGGASGTPRTGLFHGDDPLRRHAGTRHPQPFEGFPAPYPNQPRGYN